MLNLDLPMNFTGSNSMLGIRVDLAIITSKKVTTREKYKLMVFLYNFLTMIQEFINIIVFHMLIWPL